MKTGTVTMSMEMVKMDEKKKGLCNMDSVSLERPGKVIVCLNELSLLSCLNYHVYFLYRHTHTRVKRVVVNYLEGSQDPLLSLFFTIL